jgi:SAM-dependent methyltransferase
VGRATPDGSEFWDDWAATFDDEPDHGLRDPATRAAWERLLRALLPDPPADIADLGCGTGSLSVLLAEGGYRVAGIDLSPKMIAAATRKAARHGVSVEFHVGDAARPVLGPASVDAVVVRHVVWALPDPDAAVRRWVELLRAGGRLVLVEGRWNTGTGLAADELAVIVRPIMPAVTVHALTDPALWGGPITDERYALVDVPKRFDALVQGVDAVAGIGGEQRSDRNARAVDQHERGRLRAQALEVSRARRRLEVANARERDQSRGLRIVVDLDAVAGDAQ